VHICVVVVTYNSSADLTGLVPTLSVEPKSGLRATVVVVDNGSTDDTVALARGSDLVDIVIEAENRGYAAGVNAGAAAVGEFDALLVLNPDIRVHEGALEAMSLALSGDVGIVAPRLVGADGTLQWSLRREPTAARIWTTALVGGARAARIRDLGDMYREPADYARPRDVDWATGAALLISRRCWDEVGPWDESFFLYSEETDFCLRARDASFRTRFVPSATMSHFEGDMTTPQAAALRSVSAVRLYRKRHGLATTVLFLAGLVTGSTLRLARPSERAALAALLVPRRRPAPVRGLPLLARAPGPPRSS
jgi:N-acetylglucosaminyl-diphospho-decaprenol L-rhamnosyltransferase